MSRKEALSKQEWVEQLTAATHGTMDVIVAVSRDVVDSLEIPSGVKTQVVRERNTYVTLGNTYGLAKSPPYFYPGYFPPENIDRHDGDEYSFTLYNAIYAQIIQEEENEDEYWWLKKVVGTTVNFLLTFKREIDRVVPFNFDKLNAFQIPGEVQIGRNFLTPIVDYFNTHVLNEEDVDNCVVTFDAAGIDSSALRRATIFQQSPDITVSLLATLPTAYNGKRMLTFVSFDDTRVEQPPVSLNGISLPKTSNGKKFSKGLYKVENKDTLAEYLAFAECTPVFSDNGVWLLGAVAKNGVMIFTVDFERMVPLFNKKTSSVEETDFWVFWMEVICSSLRNGWAGGQKGLSNIAAAIQQREEGVLFEKFSMFIKEQPIKRAKELANELTSIVERIASQRASIVESARRIPLIEAERAALIAQQVTAEHTITQWTNLRNLPFVRAISFDAGAILVYTTDVILNCDTDVTGRKPEWMTEGTQVKLGSYLISIPVLTGDIKISRIGGEIDNNGSAIHHPHIRGSRPCFGTSEMLIISSLSNHLFVEVVQLIWEYLSCVNASDAWGSSIALWRSHVLPPQN